MLVSMGKEKMINVRLTEQTHEEFKTVAELRGASMSSLLHQFIVRAIREEKEREPQAFRKIEKNIKPVSGSGNQFEFVEVEDKNPKLKKAS